MLAFESFTKKFQLNCDGLIRNLRRQGTPDRVYFMELSQDRPIEDAIDEAFGVTKGLDRNDPHFEARRQIAMQRFLGYEAVPVSLLKLPRGDALVTEDTSEQKNQNGKRAWINEKEGLITSWETFEKYPWPDSRTWDTSGIEWLEKNLPADMCLAGRGGHFCEYLCWLMGYETLCYALYEQRDLVEALAKKILELEEAQLKALLQFKKMRIMFASDDLGFKTGLMISPDDTRKLVLTGHKRLAELSHQAGHPYLLHACGKRADIIEDLIEDVKLDAIHSWEDTIETITDAKQNYGKRLSLLGGIDVDFLCRASEVEIRKRVRETIRVCQPGGGFCLGSGNTVANYIPLNNYLVMLDEGRKPRA